MLGQNIKMIFNDKNGMTDVITFLFSCNEKKDPNEDLDYVEVKIFPHVCDDIKCEQLSQFTLNLTASSEIFTVQSG